MPPAETPPNSPSVSSDVNDNEEDILLDENDVIEILDDDDDDDDEPTAVVESEEEEEREDEDGEEMIPERDDAQTVFTEHEGGVLSCAINSTSNTMVATGGIDDNAYVWDSTNGNKLFTCKGHEDSVEVVSFSHDGSYLATADLSGIIKVWRTKDFTLVETFELDDELSWMQWHKGINVLVAASQIGLIYMYKIPSCERKMVMSPFGVNCVSGMILPDGKSLSCGYKDGSLKIVDLKQGVVLKDVKPVDEIGAITCIDTHKNNNLIICGSENGAVVLISSNSGKVASILQGSQNSDGVSYVEAVSFCKDLSYQVAASGSLDGNLIIWDIARQTIRHRHKFSSCVNHLAWHPNTPVLFTCHFEGIVRAFDAKAGVVLKEYLGHRKSCLNMCLSSVQGIIEVTVNEQENCFSLAIWYIVNTDGSIIVTTSEDKTARVFPVGNLF